MSVEIRIEPHVDRSVNVVAYEAGEQVGYVYVHDLPRREGGRQFLLYDVEVTESHRRRGIGRRMMHRIALLARERGIEEASF